MFSPYSSVCSCQYHSTVSPGGRTTGPLVAAVRRLRLTVSTWTWTIIRQMFDTGSIFTLSVLVIRLFTGAYSPGWTFGLPFWGFLITHIQTHGRTPSDECLDEWSARRRDLYLHRTTQQTNIHTPSGIRNRDPSNQAAVDLRHKSRGRWDRLSVLVSD
jgi:hypothetical protein